MHPHQVVGIFLCIGRHCFLRQKVVLIGAEIGLLPLVSGELCPEIIKLFVLFCSLIVGDSLVLLPLHSCCLLYTSDAADE